MMMSALMETQPKYLPGFKIIFYLWKISNLLIRMKHLICLFTVLAFASCTGITPDSADIDYVPSDNISDISSDEIIAEKDSWIQTMKSSDDKAFAKDIPWQDGEKVMVIRTDTEKKIDQWGRVDLSDVTYMCTVSKAVGLKCTLIPEKPLESGTYHAIYPVYDYVFFDQYKSSLYIHLSFLYDLGLGLDLNHQDIVVSESTTYKEGHKLSFVMKHICALADIDFYPPKTGNCTLIKIISDEIAFVGKAEYYLNDDYDINEIAQGWYNYTTLRGDGSFVTEGDLFHTSTGLLPIQYDGMPMKIYLAYDDGTYYLSESFSMPSLNFGIQNSLTVKEFNEISGPVQILGGGCYMDKNPEPSGMLYWDIESSITLSK